MSEKKIDIDNPSIICYQRGHVEYRVGNLVRCARCKKVIYKGK